MRTRIPTAGALVVGLALPALAATFEHSKVAASGQTQTTGTLPLSGAVTITQNLDPTNLTSAMSVACVDGNATRDTGWWRLFDLDRDHGLTGEVCVRSVDYGIESAIGTQDIHLLVGCLPDSAPRPGPGGTLFLDFVNQVASHTQPQPDATLEFFSIDGSGCCNADSESLVIGLISDDCKETDCGGGQGSCCQLLFIGANDLGETKANFINAPDCGVDDPIDGVAACFECSGVVMVVHVEGTVEEIPATTALGTVLTALLLLACSGGELRGRAPLRS